MSFIRSINDRIKDIKIDEFKLCIFIFMVGGTLGFFVEEVYDFLHNFKIDKNGFLYGFFLPIFGWGALLIHLIGRKTKQSPSKTFIWTVILTGILEYFTGDIMLKIWNVRWWDYSNDFLNINGHVCLFSVLAFGVLGLLFVYVIEPLIIFMMDYIGNRKVDIILKIFLIGYLIDNICSFLIKNKL